MRLIISLFIVIQVISSCRTTKSYYVFDITEKGYYPIEISDKSPLKEQWPELYELIRTGHLQVNKDVLRYIYSIELYRLLRQNVLRIYSTAYLQDYDNFIKIFGEPEKQWFVRERIEIAYMIVVYNDPCVTCNHSGFTYVFDEDTKKLLREY